MSHFAFVPKGDITPTKVNRLFDHLIGAGEQIRWNPDAEGLRSFEVDDQLELRRELNWERARLGALEDSNDVCCSAPKVVGRIHSVTDIAAVGGKKAERIDDWGLFAQVLVMKQVGRSLREIRALLLTNSGELKRRRRRLRRAKRRPKRRDD